MTPACPQLPRAGHQLLGREWCLPQGSRPGPSCLVGVIGSREPPRLLLSSAFGNPDRFIQTFFSRECATCFEVTAPSSWKSFQLMGKNRKTAEKGGERKLVSWESGRNILVSLLYLATEGCGQIYNKCIPPRSQDRVKLTRRNKRQVEGWKVTGLRRRQANAVCVPK